MMATTNSSNVIPPTILWAQRNDKLYLTIEIWEVCDEKLSFTNDSMSFQGTNNDTKQQYAVDLEFYGSIVPEKVSRQAGKRYIAMTIPKETSGPFWPRLTKSTSKFHFIKTDFSKWVEEDEQEEPSGPGFGDEDFDFGNLGGSGAFDGAHDFEDEEHDHDDDSDEEPLDRQVKERMQDEATHGGSSSIAASSE